jgi:hypothetical protein
MESGLWIRVQWLLRSGAFLCCGIRTGLRGTGCSRSKIGGVVYVLHGFTKKTNQTAKGDIEIGRKRWKDGRIMPRPLDLSETDLFA